uniref:GDSL esterase/lipase EXL3 n=1 Tax=Fagus sylvatica TaxID=28930 RepID=A0A2N9HBS0_FAGSY
MDFLFIKLSSTSSTILLLSLIVFALFCNTKAAIQLPPNIIVPAVIAFGDSIVDTGNNNHLKSVIKCNFAPYGKDLKGPLGRFCNGKVPVDLIAEELGIKELVPAYLDPNLQPQDLKTGVCFASSGSGYDPLTPEIAYDIPSYTDLMVNSASDFLNEIYALGARRIGVLSAPPIGCVPSQRTLAGGLHRECAEKYNIAARLFNTKLSAKLDSLNRNLPNSRMVYVDVYNPLLDLIENPQNYGFRFVEKGCCGTGDIEVAILCNPASHTCTNVSDYVFWDSYHPTEGAYKALIPPLLQKYINSFF